jgi:putative acetyltransferase
LKINWRFRRSLAGDIERLYDLWYAAVLATHGFVSESDLSHICVQVKNDYLPSRRLLVAVDGNDRVVGFMGMGGCEIESLFVDPAYHKRGLGRAFVEEASAHQQHLEVKVNAQNKQAVAFYEAVGFITYGSQPTDDDGRPYPLLYMRR